ncbi:Chloroperoxidase [Boeremia exigua]|uniref:Chloroperoxidase n=1 Tax=Boeremia exigua TaxID=749465 RepID=UPI001E8CA3E6|nr:Chloroperoxidase [Boeremia exigua]KAH6616892.1 Chloroperoxidase [Boeremia exigua]
MRLYTLFSLVAAAAALPSQMRRDDFEVRPWIAATASDSRGPCPMLNTLANHGYLPRNGRNITVEMFAEAIHTALGWSPQFGTVPANNAFKVLNITDSIELKQLDNRASGLERTSSLARADDSNAVVPARVLAVLADSDDEKYISAASLGRSRHRLELGNPLTPALQSAALIEASMTLAFNLDGPVPAAGSGADYTQLRAFKDRVQEWLTFERLPVELGWRPSVREVSTADLGPIIALISQAQAEAA